MGGAGPKLQLWSFYYDPEPIGIAPLSAKLARMLQDRGWQVEVVAAHPHYPEPRWGRRRRPYREVRDGIRILRLPLLGTRKSGAARMRQEASFAAGLLAALPALGTPDAMLVVSPSFPALAPALLNARVRRTPWVLWLQDLLPDGAIATGFLEESDTVVRASRSLERAAYRRSDAIAVVSDAFERRLLARGVSASKLKLIENPASHGIPPRVPDRSGASKPRVLTMGNIGLSQGLAALVAAFERATESGDVDADFVIAGAGVAADEVRREARSGRVHLLGLVDDARLALELQEATLALVSQRYDGAEFNLPSKLANFMAQGLPVLAVVDPEGEVARIVRESGAGWVVDSSNPAAFPPAVAAAHAEPEELARRGAAGRRYAEERLGPDRWADRFDELLRDLI
jgi:colanic acid biosynthesis glycosyl transferase WcaI